MRTPTANLFKALGLLGAIGIAIVGIAAAWRWHVLAARHSVASEIPTVGVSMPLQQDLEPRLGFLGQFAAVQQVELRAQVGGKLTGIHFTDGAIVQEGDLLFTIDPTPYEIKLSQALAQLATATARLELALRELARAKTLKISEAGTTQNVDQRLAEHQAAQAAVAEATALVRDARFDLDRCRLTAPFAGRIGTHLVSVGSLISGSRAGSGPTTLLSTLVSLDPIYLNFDMSEAEYMAFARRRTTRGGPLADNVSLSLTDETAFDREGTLDFVDNALDRSSGTIHARATVPNKDLLLTSGGFARVRLALSAPEPTLLIPDGSVLPDQATHVVLTVGDNNIVAAKPVEVGELRGGLRTIRSGLATNDRVIVDGITAAAIGATVAVTDERLTFDQHKD